MTPPTNHLAISSAHKPPIYAYASAFLILANFASAPWLLILRLESGVILTPILIST